MRRALLGLVTLGLFLMGCAGPRPAASSARNSPPEPYVRIASSDSNHVALQIAYVVARKTFGEKQREQFAVVREPRPIRADIRLHRFGRGFRRRVLWRPFAQTLWLRN